MQAYVRYRTNALARIGSRDPDDWEVLAAALVLGCPIWTEDQDFSGRVSPPGPPTGSSLYLGNAADFMGE